MVTLFDQEKVLEIHDYNVAKEARQKGIEEGISEAARKLAKVFGFSVEKAMEVLNTQD